MAYSKDIPRYKCWCGKWATKEVYNRFDAFIRYFCAACAKREVACLSKEEAAG